MEQTTINNEIAIIKNSLEVLKGGPDVLIANQLRQSKALQVGENILTAIVTTGMNEELDVRANKYLANVSNAVTEMKDSRASVTQIMDQLKKMFTTVENELDVKKAGTIPAKIQEHRNAFAKKQAEERAERQRLAEIEAAKKTEKIDIETELLKCYATQYSQYLLDKKQRLNQVFNTITLETFDDVATKLTDLQFKFGFLPQLSLPFTVRYHNNEEFQKFADAAVIAGEQQYASNYIAEMELAKEDLISKLPSKKAELIEEKRIADEAAKAAEEARIAQEKRDKELAEANEAERKRLEIANEEAKRIEAEKQAQLKLQQEQQEQERKRREDEEQKKLADAAAEAQKKAALDAEIKNQGEKTMVMFEKEAAVAETTPSAEVRQGYEIEVLHPVGYTQIFALWFEHQGKDLAIDKLGTTKLDSMKTWCEKHAHKGGSRIESAFIKYNETFKAVNRKA